MQDEGLITCWLLLVIVRMSLEGKEASDRERKRICVRKIRRERDNKKKKDVNSREQQKNKRRRRGVFPSSNSAPNNQYS